MKSQGKVQGSRVRASQLVRAIVLGAMASVTMPALAQQTSAELRGQVTGADGQPISGATVTILHVPTGTSNTATTGDSGAFLQSGLRVGGPYKVTVNAPGFEGTAVEDLNLSPGSQPLLRLSVQSTAELQEVLVAGQAINLLDLNSGVGSNFTSNDVANQPSIARDVVSTLLRDPLAISGGPNNLSVAGVNPRFNGVTIDGARQQDNFGLGSNTFATARSPINIDIIESVSLVASDFSVVTSGFTGGLVNVVTKGGTNEFDGAAFYYYRDPDFVGSKAYGGDRRFNPGEFEEKEFGLSVRGPIIEDKLFFSASYDKFETARQVDLTAATANAGLTQEYFDTLNQLVQSTYGIDMGGRPGQAAVPEETERFFLRLDWNISDTNRLQVNYQRTEDFGVSNISATNFRSAWYDVPVLLENYTVQLFSDWSPSLSSELRASFIDFSRGQVCRAEPGVGELVFRLRSSTVAGSPLEGLIDRASTIDVIGGCDRFRHANDYADERLQLFGKVDYRVNDFVITAGMEYETLDLFNVFVERSLGQFRFESAANILSRTANSLGYRNVPSNVATDGAAEWGYSRFTPFAQVRWQVTPTFELSAGLRYERLSTSDQPTLDPTFAQAVGFANTTTTDGLDLLMPRIGLRWEPLDRTTVTGGIGLFAGGEPGVWTSNAFQVPAVLASASNVAGVTGKDVPANLVAAVAAGTPLAIDAIDPDFEIPSDWKASIRIDQGFDLKFDNLDLGSNYVASAQLLYSKSKDSFVWYEGAQVLQSPNNSFGVAPDGRTIYADLDALRVSNRTILGNASGDESLVFTLSLANEFDNGFGFFTSYSYQDVEMITEGSSSRGISAFRGQLTSDRNFPEPRTSLYQIEHAFKFGLSYEKQFFADLTTRFDLFGQVNSGAPYTLTYDIGSTNALFGRAGNFESPYDNNPIYVPTSGDSKVVYASTFDQAAFNSLIDSKGVDRGQIHKVNSLSGPWQRRWDLKFQQELPGFLGDNRFKLEIDIQNVLNMLNSDWGTYANAPGFGQQAVVIADLVRASDVASVGVDAAPALTRDAPRTACTTPGACVYRYNRYTPRSDNLPSTSQSVWYAKIGLRYEF
jgi:hypothetical protein